MIAKLLKNQPKWRNFAKSGHTVHDKVSHLPKYTVSPWPGALALHFRVIKLNLVVASESFRCFGPRTEEFKIFPVVIDHSESLEWQQRKMTLKFPNKNAQFR